jgi:hypothetical protein
MVVTSKSPIDWSRITDHRKAKTVLYRNGIWNFWSFSQPEAQKLSSVQPPFCPETEFSREVDLRNSVTSQLFSGQSRLSNR